jgi:hypothetical protein
LRKYKFGAKNKKKKKNWAKSINMKQDYNSPSYTKYENKSIAEWFKGKDFKFEPSEFKESMQKTYPLYFMDVGERKKANKQVYTIKFNCILLKFCYLFK